MYEIKINEADGELMPSLTVTLDAVEVGAIYSALAMRNREHRERVQEMKDPHPNALDAVEEGKVQDAQWSLLDDMVSDLFWKWVKAHESEADDVLR